MAEKNLLFTERLESVIEECGLGAKGFAEKGCLGYSTLMNYLSRHSRGRVPEWDQLVKISKASGKSIDWLLTGDEHNQILEGQGAAEQGSASACPLCGSWPDEIKTLAEILDSDDETTKGAILSNLTAFRKSVEKDRKNAEKDRVIDELREDMRSLKKDLQKLRSESLHCTGKSAKKTGK